MAQLDQVDLLILTMFQSAQKAGKPLPSMQELQQATFKSVGTIYNRLRDLEEAGYISSPPTPHQPRSRQLTQNGIGILQQEGYGDIWAH